MTVIGIIGDDLLHSVVLLRPDLPRIGTSLGGHGLCGSRRSMRWTPNVRQPEPLLKV
jgi:hypothetical protein